MSFLIGAFGKLCKSKEINNFLLTMTYEKAKQETIQTLTAENMVIFAGNSSAEIYSSDTIIPVAQHGIFVGKMFDNNYYRIKQFTDVIGQNITANPKIVLKNYWGRYIGTLYNRQTQALTLLRDPLGLSTIFYYTRPDGIIFSTDLSSLYTVLPDKPELDLDYFAEYITNTNQALPTTPFKNIRELLPGIGFTIHASGKNSHELLWDLSRLDYSFIGDEQAFEESLLDTLKSCMKARVTDCSGVCVELSGGTDSSAVTILARDALSIDKKLVCINYMDSKEPSSNEIEYAQEVAQECDAQLHFIDWQEHSLLEDLPFAWRPNKPSSLLLFYKKIQKVRDLAEQYNCSEIMNGQGGDHIFLAPPLKESLADYWLDNGFKGIIRPTKELISIYRMPWYTLMRQTVNSIAQYYCGRRYSTREDTSFLSNDFVQHFKKSEFYLSQEMKRYHPGKAAHIESLHHAVTYSERNQCMQERTVTHPLISQPIIELGLKIPTYQSFYDGYDRILFRRSISRVKKIPALWRRFKGQTTTTLVKMYMKDADKIQEMLFEGKLVKSNIIDKQWLHNQITAIKHGQIENTWFLTHLLSSQLWLNQWDL